MDFSLRRRDLHQSSKKLEGTITVTSSSCLLTGAYLHMYDYKTHLCFYVNIYTEAWRAGCTQGEHDLHQKCMLYKGLAPLGVIQTLLV